MYFTQNEVKNHTYRIESAALDGSRRNIIVNGTDFVDSLTIDFPTNRLYFAYKNAGIIFYYDLTTKTVIRFIVDIESTEYLIAQYSFSSDA